MGSAAVLEKKEYFPALQAFRAIAALWVVLFHIDTLSLIHYLTAALPRAVHYGLFEYGRAGVAFFFAISGFVISHSLWGKAVDGPYVGRFIVRRSVRLDPAYWVSIVIAVAVFSLRAVWNDQPVRLPDVSHVAAHFLYLQELLQIPAFQSIYWTLTYEIQFYLVLALACWLVRIARRHVASDRIAAGLIFLPLTILAFVAAAHPDEWAVRGLFFNYWHAFFAGCLAYAAGYRGLNPVPLFGLCALMLVTGPQGSEIFSTPAAVGALLLYVAARTNYLTRGLSGRGWHWLGNISYSLYLIHLPALTIVAAFWGRIAGRSLLADTLALLVALAACIAAATALWFLVERPTHKWARRLFRTSAGGKEVRVGSGFAAP